METGNLPGIYHLHLLPGNKPGSLVLSAFKYVNDVTLSQGYVTISRIIQLTFIL